VIVSLEAQVESASNLTGVLLVLVALFTTEQSRRLEGQRSRKGGSESETMQSIKWIARALMGLTALAFVALAPLAWEALQSCCSGSWNPAFWIFELVWLLLVPLAAWQWRIAKKAGEGV
jgi:hypothetical protein